MDSIEKTDNKLEQIAKQGFLSRAVEGIKYGILRYSPLRKIISVYKISGLGNLSNTC